MEDAKKGFNAAIGAITGLNVFIIAVILITLFACCGSCFFFALIGEMAN